MKPIDKRISELEQQLREAKAEKERIALENPTTIGGRIYRVMRIKGVTHTEISQKAGILSPVSNALFKRSKKVPC